MTYRYSTNWMGPVRPGKYDGYYCGRIDCSSDEDNPYGNEIGVPLIKDEDWGKLTELMEGYKTETLATWEDICQYFKQQSGHEIREYSKMRSHLDEE